LRKPFDDTKLITAIGSAVLILLEFVLRALVGGGWQLVMFTLTMIA
jgi:hypothetical protein